MRSKDLADSGRTGEGDFVNSRVGTEFLADILEVGVGGDDVDDTVGDTGSSRKLQNNFLIDCLPKRHEAFQQTYLDDGKGGERGLGRSLDDRSTSDGESRTHLPGNHGSGEVPGTK